jgi:glycosyltransferase involved in cell wall biosynthesis
VAQACREATLVTVSTKPLAAVYAKHGRWQVIDNYVPESYLDVEPQEHRSFGWPGTTQSHPDDLQVMGGAVRDLVADGLDFRVIGPRSGVQKALRLPEEPEHTGRVEMDDWVKEVATLQVCLAPLSASKFNLAKSRLKLIEASAVGVPWVASPRPEYRRTFAESGAGILADTPKQWYVGVRKLMGDDVLRKELGERGREWMQTQTIEANSWRWLEAWTRAYEIQQGSRATS